MVYPLLSYVQIRVSVILSLGFRFSLAGPRSLGVALEVGRLVFLYPTVTPSPVIGGFVLWFPSPLDVTNLDEPVLLCSIDFPCVGYCGAQSMP